MDSWEWNKIAGAVLGTLIFVLVVKFAADAIFEAPAPAKPGYVVEGVPEASRQRRAAAAACRRDAARFRHGAARRPTSPPARRSRHAASSATTSPRAGPNKIGPNLWGVVGRARATHPGFDYSSAMIGEPRSVDLSTNLFRYPEIAAGHGARAPR